MRSPFLKSTTHQDCTIAFIVYMPFHFDFDFNKGKKSTDMMSLPISQNVYPFSLISYSLWLLCHELNVHVTELPVNRIGYTVKPVLNGQ